MNRPAVVLAAAFALMTAPAYAQRGGGGGGHAGGHSSGSHSGGHSSGSHFGGFFGGSHPSGGATHFSPAGSHPAGNGPGRGGSHFEAGNTRFVAGPTGSGSGANQWRGGTNWVAASRPGLARPSTMVSFNGFRAMTPRAPTVPGVRVLGPVSGAFSPHGFPRNNFFIGSAGRRGMTLFTAGFCNPFFINTFTFDPFALDPFCPFCAFGRVNPLGPGFGVGFFSGRFRHHHHRRLGFFPAFFGPGFGFLGAGFFDNGFTGDVALLSQGMTAAPPEEMLAPNEPVASTFEPNPAEAPAEPQAAESALPPVSILVFKDGSIYGITDYWLEDGRLHYLTNYGGENVVPLERIDLDTTAQMNWQRGTPFVLRPKPQSE